MELKVLENLQKAIGAHAAGQTEKAHRLYTYVLKADPKHADANHNMGVLAVSVGKASEALPFFEIALEANPKIVQFWLSYIDTLLKLERLADAKAVFERARSNGVEGDAFDKLKERLNSAINTQTISEQEPPEDELKILIKIYIQGELQKALLQSKILLVHHPNSAILFNIQGAIFRRLGQFGHAITALENALSIKPDYSEAHNNLGNILKEQGKLKEAIDAYQKALKFKPDYAEAHHNLGITFQEYGQLENAILAHSKALSFKPNLAEAYNSKGIALQKLGKLKEAVGAYETALTIRPNYAEAQNNMGNALKEGGYLNDAISAYRTAISNNANLCEAYNNIGTVLKAQGELKEAADAFTRALTIRPNYAEAHRHLASINTYSGNEPQFAVCRKIYKDPGLSESDKCHLNFALAKMHEDISNYDKAFRHFVIGNGIQKKMLNYTFANDQQLFKKLKNGQIGVFDLSIEAHNIPTEVIPIFILGMPRSGTSLAEQVISSHSKVEGLGELNTITELGAELALGIVKLDVTKILNFRKAYLSEISRQARGAKFVTDKMPSNFKYLGLICTAFPEAKIIHTLRDPAATCWSNFKTYFPSENLSYSNDLEDVAKYYNLYMEHMHFCEARWGRRIFNLSYERLTQDQENETREVLKYLQLEWEVGCLSPENNKRPVSTASAVQVRKKVYRNSSLSWRKYERLIAGRFDALPSHFSQKGVRSA